MSTYSPQDLLESIGGAEEKRLQHLRHVGEERVKVQAPQLPMVGQSGTGHRLGEGGEGREGREGRGGEGRGREGGDYLMHIRRHEIGRTKLNAVSYVHVLSVLGVEVGGVPTAPSNHLGNTKKQIR